MDPTAVVVPLASALAAISTIILLWWMMRRSRKAAETARPEEQQQRRRQWQRQQVPSTRTAPMEEAEQEESLDDIRRRVLATRAAMSTARVSPTSGGGGRDSATATVVKVEATAGASRPAGGSAMAFLFVDGMSCEHCEAQVRDAVRSALGADATSMAVSVGESAVAVGVTPSAGVLAKLTAAIQGCGKTAVAVDGAVALSGMTCEHCSAAVREALASVDGVARVSVVLGWGLGIYAAADASSGAPPQPAAIIDAIQATGKRARLIPVRRDPDGTGDPLYAGAPFFDKKFPLEREATTRPLPLPLPIPSGYGTAATAMSSRCVLRVDGMQCNGCADQVRHAIEAVPCVASALVDVRVGRATVEGRRALEGTEVAAIVAAVAALGDKGARLMSDAELREEEEAVAATARSAAESTFSADEAAAAALRGEVTVRLGIEGMTCAACVKAVEDALMGVSGVKAASVALMIKTAQVRIDSSAVDVQQLLTAVARRGYRATEHEDAASGSSSVAANVNIHTEEARRLFVEFALSALFTLPVVFISMILPMLPFKQAKTFAVEIVDGLSLHTLLLWVLTTPVQFIFGWRFYVGAYKALRHCSTNMDVLVMLGSSAAYAYSVFFLVGNVVTGGRMFLMEPGMFMGCGALAHESTMAFQVSAMRMHSAMAFQLTCDANVDFARGMLAHHVGALDACDLFLEHAGSAADPAMSHFCTAHVGPAQTMEVNLLRGWLTANGHSHGAPKCGTMHEMACGNMSCAASVETLAANKRMHADMSIRFSGDASVDFARTMIPHHEGAIAMCATLAAHGDDAELLSLCERIVAAQTMEINELRTWLLFNGHGVNSRCGAEQSPTSNCDVVPAERWGCGVEESDISLALIEMRDQLHAALNIKYGCMQESDLARSILSVYRGLNVTCAALNDDARRRRRRRRLAHPNGATFYSVCANLEDSLPASMNAMRGFLALASATGRRQLGHPSSAVSSAAGTPCDTTQALSDAVEGVELLFLEASTPAAGTPDQRRADAGFFPVGCGDLLCPSNRLLTDRNAQTLSQLGFEFTGDVETDAGRTMYVLIDDLLARCQLLQAPLNAVLPALAEALAQPLLSPGPYTVDDAQLAAARAAMETELTAAEASMATALAGGGGGGGGGGASLNELLAPTCPTGDCPVRAVFMGCGKVQGCASTNVMMDALWAQYRQVSIAYTCDLGADFAAVMAGLLEGAANICSALQQATSRGTISLSTDIVDQCVESATLASVWVASLRSIVNGRASSDLVCSDPLDASAGCGSSTCLEKSALQDVLVRLHRRSALVYTCDAPTDAGRVLHRQLQAQQHACDVLEWHKADVGAGGVADDLHTFHMETLGRVCSSVYASARAGEEALARHGRSGQCVEALAHVHVHGSSFGMGHSDEEEVFETAAMLIMFILLGKALEALAKGRTSQAISRLLRLQPPTALRVPGCWDNSGEASEVPISELKLRDVVKILPGAQVPADGKVLRGRSVVDEAIMTGESLPVVKKPGDAVVGGAINGQGVLYVLVEATGSTTVLATIMRIVSEAQHRKVPVQQFADRISRVFVPFVVAAAIVTYASWAVGGALGAVTPAMLTDAGVRDPNFLAFMFGCAVLVVACPCALGLATPTAVMVSCALAASRLGLLVKGGDVLEYAARVTAILFDKTGTLTTGRIAVHALCRCDGDEVVEVETIPAHARVALSGEDTAKDDKHASSSPAAAGGAAGAPTTHPSSSAAASVALSNEMLHVLRLAASAESSSQHPIAKAVVRAHAVLAGGGATSATAAPKATQTADGSAAAGEEDHAFWVAKLREAEEQGLPKRMIASLRKREEEARSIVRRATVPDDPSAVVEALFVEEVAGEGLRCVVGDRAVLAGNRGWLASHGLQLSAAQEETMVGYEAIGCTAVLVAATERKDSLRLPVSAESSTPRGGAQLPWRTDAVEGERVRVDGLRLVAIIAVSDVLKPEAPAIVAHLKQSKVDVWMASGDNARTARHIAALANIAPERVLAGVKPEGKKRKIEELQQGGHVVAMVGDGINDAPALAQANVGIAVGSGTDVAFETADMVLMRPHLHGVLTAVDLARATLRRIKLNFVWAFAYNVVGIPFAAGVFYPAFRLHLPPMFAGIAMVGSSVSVVCSSLMLNCYRPPAIVRKAERAMAKAAVAAAAGGRAANAPALTRAPPTQLFDVGVVSSSGTTSESSPHTTTCVV